MHVLFASDQFSLLQPFTVSVHAVHSVYQKETFIFISFTLLKRHCSCIKYFYIINFIELRGKWYYIQKKISFKRYRIEHKIHIFTKYEIMIDACNVWENAMSIIWLMDSLKIIFVLAAMWTLKGCVTEVGEDDSFLPLSFPPGMALKEKNMTSTVLAWSFFWRFSLKKMLSDEIEPSEKRQNVSNNFHT